MLPQHLLELLRVPRACEVHRDRSLELHYIFRHVQRLLHIHSSITFTRFAKVASSEAIVLRLCTPPLAYA